MSFFRSLLNSWANTRSEDAVTTNVVTAEGLGFGGGSDTMVADPDRALMIATVFACVRIKASAVASLGLRVMKRKSTVVDGESQQYFTEDIGNILDMLLRYKPNDRMNAYELIYNAVALMDLTGNAYIIPVYRGGALRKLVLTIPYSVTYDKNENTYLVHDSVNKIYGTYHADEIIHLKNITNDGGYTGVSTLTYAARVLGIATNTDTTQADQFKAGSTIRGFVSGDGGAAVKGWGQNQDSQLNDVSNIIRKQINQRQNVFWVPGDMRFNQISLSPAELQLLDSKKFNVRECCRFFNVPPEKVFENNSTNYKASENSQTVFLSDCLHPLICQFESEFNVKLIGVEGLSKYRIKFDLSEYYATDLTSKANYYQKSIQNGTMTPNEVRLKEGMIPLDGGNTAFISCNVAPINSAKIKGESTSKGADTNPNE